MSSPTPRPIVEEELQKCSTIDHWSVGLDLKILARTLPSMIAGRGGTSRISSKGQVTVPAEVRNRRSDAHRLAASRITA